MGKQARKQNGSHMQASNDARHVIRPSSLSKSDVRQIQMKLNKAGFSAKNVDGIWGREAADALSNFQKVKGLPGRGELSQQTPTALGVKNQESVAGAERHPEQTTTECLVAPGPSREVQLGKHLAATRRARAGTRRSRSGKSSGREAQSFLSPRSG